MARKLLDLANVPTNATIHEIPVNWDNQVVILFLLPNDDNYYSLFSGISKDGNFHFELSITGILSENIFDFYNEDKELDIDYFLNYEVVSKQFAYYEEGTEQLFIESELQSIYTDTINKAEYPDFDSWFYDMTKMQILIER
jgi:hypothetical protein